MGCPGEGGHGPPRGGRRCRRTRSPGTRSLADTGGGVRRRQRVRTVLTLLGGYPGSLPGARATHGAAQPVGKAFRIGKRRVVARVRSTKSTQRHPPIPRHNETIQPPRAEHWLQAAPEANAGDPTRAPDIWGGQGSSCPGAADVSAGSDRPSSSSAPAPAAAAAAPEEEAPAADQAPAPTGGFGSCGAAGVGAGQGRGERRQRRLGI